jgi:hypothetical protein
MNYWQNVLAALPTSGVLTLGLGIFLWHYLKRKTEADIADTYKKKEQERQAEHQRELEGWKAGYVKALDENRIKFARLHEERMQAIQEVYGQLRELEICTAHFERFFFNQDSDRFQHDFERANDAFNKVRAFYRCNKILFTQTDCKLIDDLLEQVKISFFECFVINGETPNVASDVQMNAYKRMTQAFPNVLLQLE